MTRALRSLALFLVAACSAGEARTSSDVAPDVVFHGGRVVTMNGASDVVEAVAVRDGRIVAVGSDAAVRGLASASTRLVDLGGRTVLPGFADNHVHLGETLQEWHGALISGVPEWIRGADTMEELARRIRERAAQTPPGEWITGALTREEWPNQKLPTRWLMDEWAPDHPVALDRGPHTIVLNSRALAIAGIDRSTPDPPGGWIVRDERGEPNGRVLEAADRLVRPHLPRRAGAPRRPAVERYRDFLVRLETLGITSVNVAGVRPDALGDIQELYARHGDELPRMTVQVRISPGYDSYDDPVEGAREAIREIESLGIHTGFGDDRLRIGAIKMSIDGGLSAPVMWTSAPYAGREGFHGVQRIPDETFYQVAKAAHERGWQLGVHVIGDAAAVMVVEQLARILAESPRDDHRHYLHHLAVTPPDATLAKMAELGIAAAIHPSWITNLGGYAEEALGRGPALHAMMATRTLLDRGIRVSFGSDGLPYGPLFNLWDAVTRVAWDGSVWGAQEAIGVEEAIRLHTQGVAWMTFAEDERGSIEVGKLADMVVLGEDILSVDPMRIRDIPVEMTIVGGRVVHETATARAAY